MRCTPSALCSNPFVQSLRHLGSLCDAIIDSDDPACADDGMEVRRGFCRRRDTRGTQCGNLRLRILQIKANPGSALASEHRNPPAPTELELRRQKTLPRYGVFIGRFTASFQSTQAKFPNPTI